MRIHNVIVAGVVVAGLGCAAADSENVTLNNGVQISIHTSLGKPTGTTSVAVEMQRAAGDSFYRIFRDQNRLAVFAYELQVARSGTTGFRLTTKPVEDEFARRFPGADGGKPVPTFSAEKDYTLNNGEPATIALYELEGQGLAVVDTVQMGLNPSSSGSGGALRFSGIEPYGQWRAGEDRSREHRLRSLCDVLYSRTGRFLLFVGCSHGAAVHEGRVHRGQQDAVHGGQSLL